MRLSEALRSAADRAPLEGIEVDAARARRRVATQRGLRMGANGTLAGGMVVVLGFGVAGAMDGMAGSMDSTSGEGREEAAVAEDGALGGTGDAGDMSAEADAAGGGAASSLAWGLCGEELPELGTGDDPLATIDASVTTPEVSDGVLGFDAGLASSVDATFETFGMSGVVLWDGVVVATIPAVAREPGESYGSQLMSDAIGMEMREEPLENCWDGSALPAGDYTLVLTQELYGIEPLDAEPAPEPAPADGGASEEPGPVDDAATDPGIAADASIRLVSEPMPFTVTGDAEDDPFAAYLGGSDDPAPVQVDPPATEPSSAVDDSALDPGTARELYLAGLAGAWDMAPGTQRWTVSSDWSGGLDATWFGCGNGTFPARSSEIDLLGVEVDAPSVIDVSYGWVIDGNPLVSTTLTNTSDWDLTQFWGQNELQLMLVRDGKVVAEGYAVDPHRDAYAVDMLEAERAEADGTVDVDPTATLAAHASDAAEFLWREVDGCWTDSGASEVEPGTYTLLASHYLSVGGGVLTMEDGWGTEDEAWLGDGDTDLGLGSSEPLLTPDDSGLAATGGRTSGSSAGSDAAIAVAPDAYDAVDFQVWTSLGTVTVR
ncbi:hypothetical protein [Demequina gelatinilytica]|uniref:hypothetical protein n=1 Tax=Demequina gelatinilytica TaxID=1638980 RepID=UPI000783F36C|nr:hypothetical protein [Demequina gelatinilytica]